MGVLDRPSHLKPHRHSGAVALLVVACMILSVVELHTKARVSIMALSRAVNLVLAMT
jgi:hypothetical protein